jgi:hypothetical protein
MMMNDMEEEKRVGRAFIQRLRSQSNDIEAFKVTVQEFASESSENRVTVAMSLLAIGADPSERPFDRNFALAQLGLFTRTCGLRNNERLQEQLSGIIDSWVSALPDGTFPSADEYGAASIASDVAPWGALSALGAVNRRLALEKCDHVIELYGESEAGRQVSKIRAGIERLNPIGG